MLGLCSVLLIEGETCLSCMRWHELSLIHPERGHIKVAHTVLLWAFYRKNGLDAIVNLCRTFMQSISQHSAVSPDERSEASSQELIHAHGGLKVALHLMLSMVSAKPILESPQTLFLQATDKKNTDPDYFEAHSFVVRMRLVILPLIREIWEASWLVSSPLSVSKSVIQVVLELLNVENEDAREGALDAASLVNVPIPRPVGADENRIRQLVDMGFPRYAAERALIRARNNVNAATEYLLAQPLPFPPEPQPQEAVATPDPAPE